MPRLDTMVEDGIYFYSPDPWCTYEDRDRIKDHIDRALKETNDHRIGCGCLKCKQRLYEERIG